MFLILFDSLFLSLPPSFSLSLPPSLSLSLCLSLFLSLSLSARSKGKRTPRELFGVYQQHLVYRDGVGDRERDEPDDEAGPQSVEADGARHRRRDDGGEGSGDGGPTIQESGQSATTARVNTEGVLGNGQYSLPRALPLTFYE